MSVYILNSLEGGIKERMKMLRSKKALSPVVASIILIAVTVAVSIAVAAWMGALTFTFTNTEQITFTGYSWPTPGTGTTVPYILITIKNTGASDLSISEVRVDGVTASHNGTFPYALLKGYSVKLNITRTGSYNRGTQYSFMVITAKGNQFGPYTQTAP
jgi:flagellin-like protein